jgi:hypothetical protein
MVSLELESAQRVVKATGDAGYRAMAVALSDSLTKYFRSDHRRNRAAESAGVSRDRWQEIKRGYVQAHTRKKGRPYPGRPFLAELLGQRPLPTVEVTWPVEACCWMSCTHWW